MQSNWPKEVTVDKAQLKSVTKSQNLTRFSQPFSNSQGINLGGLALVNQFVSEAKCLLGFEDQTMHVNSFLLKPEYTGMFISKENVNNNKSIASCFQYTHLNKQIHSFRETSTKVIHN